MPVRAIDRAPVGRGRAALDLAHECDDVGRIGLQLENAFALQQGRRIQAHVEVGFRQLAGNLERRLDLADLQVGFLEDVVALTITWLRLADDLEHLDGLKNLGVFFTGELGVHVV